MTENGELARIDQLRRSGALTDDESEQARSRYLARLADGSVARARLRRERTQVPIWQSSILAALLFIGGLALGVSLASGNSSSSKRPTPAMTITVTSVATVTAGNH